MTYTGVNVFVEWEFINFFTTEKIKAYTNKRKHVPCGLEENNVQENT